MRNLIPMPRPIRVPAPPKIAAVHVTPMGGGFRVNHFMHQAPMQKFSFDDPAKMLQHVAKIQKNAWRQPDANPAASINRTMNDGPTV